MINQPLHEILPAQAEPALTQDERDAALIKIFSFCDFVIKCVHRNGEYAPASKQEPHEIKTLLDSLSRVQSGQAEQQPVSEIRRRALDLYKPPFRFEHGYIFAANGEMVADQHDGPNSLRVRGWGRISYMEDPEKLQDEVGAMIAEALNAKWGFVAPVAQPAPRCQCCGYLVTQSEHRGCLRASQPDTHSLVEVLETAASTLDDLQGEINPERGYADELEAEVTSTLESVRAALSAYFTQHGDQK